MTRSRVLVSLIPVLAAASSFALDPDAAGLGRGGVDTVFAQGASALWSNPTTTNDGLISVGLGVVLDGGNNALTMNRFFGIITGGQSGKDNAIKDVTDYRAKTGNNWAALITGGAGLAVAVEGIAIGVSPQVRLSADNVTPDALTYALNQSVPLVLGKHYDIEGTFAEQTYERISLGYGMKIPVPIPLVSFFAGADLAYLNGTDLTYTSMDQQFDVGAPTLPTSYAAYAKSKSGKGFTGDVGISMKALAGLLKAAVVIKDIGAKMVWDGDVQVGTFNQSTLSFNYTDVKQNIDIKLPTTLVASVGGQIPGVGTGLGVQVDVPGLNGKDDLTKEPTNTRLHLGAEQKILGVLGFRLGYETKADPVPQQVTAGLTVGAILVHLDLGVGFDPSGKGGSVGLSAQAAL